ncbi:MAG: hypothetical protein M0Z31_03955, partial [Clostridia bacterium]|nr:hypothetical protein [Clostridia bacterium]
MKQLTKPQLIRHLNVLLDLVNEYEERRKELIPEDLIDANLSGQADALIDLSICQYLLGEKEQANLSFSRASEKYIETFKFYIDYPKDDEDTCADVHSALRGIYTALISENGLETEMGKVILKTVEMRQSKGQH